MSENRLDFLFEDQDMALALHKSLVALERIAWLPDCRQAALLATDCVRDVQDLIHPREAA